MKVAVTGGSGELGTLVLRRLAAERSVKQVISLDLQPPCTAGAKLRAVKADVRDPEIGRYFEGCDAVIHLAFIVTRAPEQGVFHEVNVGGSRNVFEAAARAGVKRLIYSSSIAAYGVMHGHPQPITEETPRRKPDFAYSAAKYEVEEFLDTFEPAHPEMAVARIRPGILIGTHMDHALGDALRRGFIADTGPTPMPVVWDDDVAELILLALKAGARGAYNAVADEPLPPAALAQAAGYRSIPLPRVLVKSVAKLSVRLGRLGLVRSVDPTWVDKVDVPMVASSAKARRELGWKPRASTAAQVLRLHKELSPGRGDPRLRVFFRLIALASQRMELPEDAKRVNARLYLCLTGPGGGDFDLRFQQGVMKIREGVPRPPNVVVTMKAETFRDLLSARMDYATAQLTGKVRIEGEALAGMIVQGLVSGFRQQAGAAGLAAWPARRLQQWLAQGAAT